MADNGSTMFRWGNLEAGEEKRTHFRVTFIYTHTIQHSFKHYVDVAYFQPTTHCTGQCQDRSFHMSSPHKHTPVSPPNARLQTLASSKSVHSANKSPWNMRWVRLKAD